ncbi:hypothetical protein [Solidesulfovibrio sp. C21]|uniref:hypothetical protein n=1 Tax=Solidesulfovibrio sp. C21 TaxID=3398613 RepID=UPI0039FDA8A9
MGKNRRRAMGAPQPERKVSMLSLRYTMVLFVMYFMFFWLFYRFYFRPRIYLLLLSEPSYMDHYIDKLPHMCERPDERLGMIEFMLAKRKRFVRAMRQFVFTITAAYVALLILGATL